MNDSPEPVVTHPVAPRLAGGGKDGQKEPHVGPDLAAYRAVHAETVGTESARAALPSRPRGAAGSRRGISRGSPRAG
ncbi:hypothetical protein B0H13DRAFT_1946937 [Mycena leptocephala]|nr:hypothetical protein B0H13DRAFT_1946937 [Mycena leptocephala]